jgi:hypothetical protein
MTFQDEIMKEDQGGDDVKVTMKFPKLLTKQLKVYAGVKGVTMTSVVIQACEEFMERDRFFKEKFKPHIS